MIQRYMFQGAQYGYTLDESDDGDYVKWEDVKHLADACDEDSGYFPDPGYTSARVKAFLNGHPVVFDFDTQQLVDAETGEVLWQPEEDNAKER
jgi:hypothetical protein